MTNNNELEYAGFWIRVWAIVIDTFLILIITLPILSLIDGIDYYILIFFIIRDVLPAFAIILFWMYHQATPGKMAISAKIVDAQTGKKPSTRQCIGRYFAYIPSVLFFGLGVFWIAFDKRKQGWHDKLAGTVVVKKKNLGADGKSERFREKNKIK